MFFVYGKSEDATIFVLGEGEDAIILPERPDYYYTALASPPPPAPRTQPGSHPIFYMHPGAEGGEDVALHLFEPRYRLLIQRVWAGDKVFIYCARAPFSSAARASFNLPLDEEPQDDGCVAVQVERAHFGEDGEADIQGRAIERVLLRDVLIEPGTGGLYSTTTPLATPTPLATTTPLATAMTRGAP